MALTYLPTELLETIITHTLPEGFESLAFTCRRICLIFKPLTHDHNTLCSRFHNFAYAELTSDASNIIRTAFDVIARIAVEPIVARYIRHADFALDSRRGRPRWLLADLHCGGAVHRLLADSPYLRQAGLDWQESYARIEEGLEAVPYSQHAVSFLVTLLPNVDTLILPQKWKHLDGTNELINAIVRRTNEAYSPEDRPQQDNPFLALPQMRSFRGTSCEAMGDDGHMNNPSNNPERGFGKTLIEVDFAACCLDDVAITDFLHHTTHLRTLRYSHLTKAYSGPQDWNICKIITAIERKVGTHLEQLSISIRELRGSITLGSTSMRGFQRLRVLEFPLEIAAATGCRAAIIPNVPLVVRDSSTDEHYDLVHDEPFISDFVPASVSQLSVLSSGTNDQAKGLNVMFRHFAATKASTLPALEEIQLSCPDNATVTYKDPCTRLLAETVKTGVVLRLSRCPADSIIIWNEYQGSCQFLWPPR
ncbi:MAG: hypothetical protein Q9172_005389 [Xanthocarpia lactea]